MVDAVLWVDTRAAAATDDLTLTVDYGGRGQDRGGDRAGEPVALIETLADRLAAACLADQAVTRGGDHRAQAARADDPAVRGRDRHHPPEPRMRREHRHGRTGGPERAGRAPVVLALGSNLGDRLANLQGAVDALCAVPGLDCAAVSPVYETARSAARTSPTT